MEKLIVDGIDLTEFLGVPYAASRHPGNVSVDEFLSDPRIGANCQLFALGVLRKAGFYIDDQLPMDQGERFGSRELWLDIKFTDAIVADDQSAQRNINILLNTGGAHLNAVDIEFYFPPGYWSSETLNNVREEDLKRLHVALRLGRIEGWGSDNPCRILHNAKPGPSALWTLKDFHDMGYLLFGIKRPICRIAS